MSNLGNRVHDREYYEVPLVFTDFHESIFSIGRTINTSSGGICFQTQEPVKPGLDLVVKLSSMKAPLDYYKDSPPDIRGEVIWTKDLNGGYIGVGMKKSITVYLCDMCGDKVSYNKIVKKQSHIYLCQDCAKHYDALPNSMVTGDLDEFLLGNVI